MGREWYPRPGFEWAHPLQLVISKGKIRTLTHLYVCGAVWPASGSLDGILVLPQSHPDGSDAAFRAPHLALRKENEEEQWLDCGSKSACERSWKEHAFWGWPPSGMGRARIVRGRRSSRRRRSNGRRCRRRRSNARRYRRSNTAR